MHPLSPYFPHPGIWHGINPDFIETFPKEAILLSSFGTTFPETRTETINAIRERLRKEFPGIPVFEAWTSHIVIKRVKGKEGLIRRTPEEAMQDLYLKGFTRITVVSLAIIPGMEYEYMANTAKAFLPHFKSITMALPLLYFQGTEGTPDHVLEMLKALRSYIGENQKKEAALLMAHGTPHPANAYYAVIQERIKEMGWKRTFVYTVEGRPSLSEVIPVLKKKKIKKVRLYPLMLVAGDHAINDMAGEEKDSHKNTLRDEGFEVTTTVKGIGAYEEIQDIFIERAQEAHAAHKKAVIGRNTEHSAESWDK